MLALSDFHGQALPFSFSEVIAGQARINDIRDLEIEDMCRW